LALHRWRFIVLAALAWLALAVMLFGRFTKRPGYIPDLRLSRRGKWPLALRLARKCRIRSDPRGSVHTRSA
jgi:hypothetical protein